MKGSTTTTKLLLWMIFSICTRLGRSFPVNPTIRQRQHSSSILVSRFSTIKSRLGKIQSSSTRCFGSLSFSSSDDKSTSEEDLLKWERMYAEGGKTNLFSDKNNDDYDSPYKAKSEVVRVVTFDLDNTIWNTTHTIAVANDVLSEFMEEKIGKKNIRVEKYMKKLFQNNVKRYCPMVGDDDDNKKIAPVLLTLLRKDAIQEVLKENAYDEETAVKVADEAFDVWMDGRVESIGQHLAGSVFQCLDEIRSKVTNKNEKVLIGAITDGNSNPTEMKLFRDYFDFCVNAEMVGVSKPDKRLYLKAARDHVFTHSSMREMIPADKLPVLMESKNDDKIDDLLEELIGPWWVHVGDDFVKDVVAAKNLNMRSIWCRELVMDKIKKAEEPKTKAETTEKNGRTVEDLVKEVAETKVIEMQVGTEDYLADSLQREFCDAVIDEFKDLSSILYEWHVEGVAQREKSATEGILEVIYPDGAGMVDADLSEEIIAAGKKEENIRDSKDVIIDAVTSSETATLEANGKSSKEIRETKYCLFCGEKLPAVAKFCSACGEKQV